MSSAVSRSPRLPSRRWWTLVGFIFALQIGAIAWLGQRGPVLPRPAAPAPSLQLAGPGAAELVALTDPTLFVLPHPEGFAGNAWLRAPTQEFRPFSWSEPPRWLPLPAEQLGASFEHFLRTNPFPELPLTPLRVPQAAFTEPAAALNLPAHSTLRLTGALAERRMLTKLELPSWPHSDLLTNSVVQVLLGPEGTPLSFTLLASSGSKEADFHALSQARAARFQPLPAKDTANPLAGLSWGELIFEWQTVPPPATNTIVKP